MGTPNIPFNDTIDLTGEMETTSVRGFQPFFKDFSVTDFLQKFPDPWAYFSDVNRSFKNFHSYEYFSSRFLKSVFKKKYVRDINKAMELNNRKLYPTYQYLRNDNSKRMQNKRRVSDFNLHEFQIDKVPVQFLDELAFLENEEQIKAHFDASLECLCRLSRTLLTEIIYCPKDHQFCKNCVIKYVEVGMGEGRSTFSCLENCSENFSMNDLQDILLPDVLSKLMQKLQLEEVRAAKIDDLVDCPHCVFAVILPPEVTIITCLNPECLKVTCRLCKEPNHLPLRCNEVEKPDDVKIRTYIEDKMTEALVRSCYRCRRKFVKEEGCNRMSCTCGAKMCYVCRKPVTDYSHFNGQGATEFHKCPLYSTMDQLRVDAVAKVAEEAKAQILRANPDKKLVFDPTVILPERINDQLMPGMLNPQMVQNLHRFL